MLRDKFNRAVKYLRISLTESCNLQCSYCRSDQGEPVPSHRNFLNKNEIFLITKAFSEIGVSHVRLSGGEPLLRKDVCDVINEISQLPHINDISLTTNGILLDKFAPSLKEAGLHRLNISLDSIIPSKFKEITRGGNLNSVLKGIDAALASGLTPIKINMVVMKGVNDDEVIPMIEFCLKKRIILRLIEFMPIGVSAKDMSSKHITAREIHENVSKHFSLEKTTMRGPGPAWYEYVKGDGLHIGFISAVSQHFCGSCNRVRLMANGKLHLCLGHDKQIDLAAAVRNPDVSEDELKDHIRAVVWNKPGVHRFNKNGSTGNRRVMSAIGG